jgi:hypothetical protein
MPKHANLLPSAAFVNTVIVVTARDEEQSLRKTVESLADLCSPEDVEHLVVFMAPDSTEGLRAEVRRLSETVKQFPVRALLQQTQTGVVELQHYLAAESKASHTLLLSADLEIEPQTALQMLKAGKQSPDALVSISRWRKGGGFFGYPKLQLPIHFFFQIVVRFLYGARLSTDATAGYAALPKRIFEGLCLREKRQSVFLEYKLTLLRLGLPLVEIPAQFCVRREGKSTGSFWHKVRYLVPLVRVRFTPRMRLFSLTNGGKL